MQFEMETCDDGLQCVAVIGEISPVEPGLSAFQEQCGGSSFTKPILLNLESAPFINSAGIGWLLTLHKRSKADGGRLILHSLAPAVRNVVKLMSVDRVLEISDDRLAAAKLVMEQLS